MFASAPLPGITFQTEPEPPAETLPRMDIAAFVGFAAAGPVDTPVVVEDLDRYREIFGPDLALAWDPDAGKLQHAYLGPTVEAFFRTGGRRCWIVRVADSPTTQGFALPELVATDDRSPARIEARSPGSWADDLRVGTVLERELLPALGDDALEAAIGDYTLGLAIGFDEVVAGDLIELRWHELSLRLLLFVDTVASEAGGIRVRGNKGFWFEEPAADLADALAEDQGLDHWRGSPMPPVAVHRLSFSLLAWRADGFETAAPDPGRELVGQLSHVAFHPEHPRFFGRLPSDDQLFALPNGRQQPPVEPAVAAFLEAAASPRFPLAAASIRPRPFLPVGMAADARTARAHGPSEPLTRTALERDGLARLSWQLFVDPEAAWASGNALLLEMEHKLYERRERLSGMHSLLPVDEPTLIAVPDAVHRGWTRIRPAVAGPLGAPTLVSVEVSKTTLVRVAWTSVQAADGYRVEQDTAPNFVTAREVARTDGLVADVKLDDPCPHRLYFRVRAAEADELGPWSNTHTAILPPSAFLDCDEALVPGFHLAIEPGGSTTARDLVWTPDPDLPGTDQASDFEIESSPSTGFEAATTTKIVPATTVADALDGGGLRFVRVRGRADHLVGPWSNTVVVLPSGFGEWRLEAPEVPAANLLAVQRALLRFCAARRDLLALLAAPAGQRDADLIDHLRRLEPGDNQAGTADVGRVRPLRLSEREALGFGAFFHPWVTTLPEQRARDGAGLALAVAPPEGTIAGSMAAQAIRDGAWIAPANRILDGILALEPPIDRGVLPGWLRRRINLLIQEPRGFVVANAETLSSDPASRPVSIRRLLILLRRLALRVGDSYVFEPNDQRLRDRLRQRFEGLLSDLFVRGALAGRVADEAFRVVVDTSVNTPQTAARGQFLAELRIAPSRPLTFLRIRLVQDGPERLTVEEV